MSDQSMTADTDTPVTERGGAHSAVPAEPAAPRQRQLPVQPLLEALDDLIAAHTLANRCAGALVDALARADVPAIQEAVAAQTRVAETIEQAEKRRQAATAALSAQLSAISRQPSAASTDQPQLTTQNSQLTTSELLALLPPDEAAQLRARRHALLGVLLHLQTTSRQAALLLHNAQAVLRRVVRASTPQTVGYGPRGEHMVPRLDRRYQQVRQA